MVPLLFIPVVTDISQSLDSAFEAVLWFIWAVFAVDLAIRTALAEHRVSYLAHHWYDVLIVAIPFLRPLRIARSVRSLRLLRMARILPFLARGWATLHQLVRRRGLQYVLLAGMIAVFASAAVVLGFEKDQGEINDYGTALWWAVATITTVGYGDAVPETPEGRGLAVFLMLMGISFFSWVTASIAAFLVEFGEEGRPVSNNELLQKLESLEVEIRALRSERTSPDDSIAHQLPATFGD